GRVGCPRSYSTNAARERSSAVKSEDQSPPSKSATPSVNTLASDTPAALVGVRPCNTPCSCEPELLDDPRWHPKGKSAKSARRITKRVWRRELAVPVDIRCMRAQD